MAPAPWPWWLSAAAGSETALSFAVCRLDQSGSGQRVKAQSGAAGERRHLAPSKPGEIHSMFLIDRGFAEPCAQIKRCRLLVGKAAKRCRITERRISGCQDYAASLCFDQSTLIVETADCWRSIPGGGQARQPSRVQASSWGFQLPDGAGLSKSLNRCSYKHD